MARESELARHLTHLPTGNPSKMPSPVSWGGVTLVLLAVEVAEKLPGGGGGGRRHSRPSSEPATVIYSQLGMMAVLSIFMERSATNVLQAAPGI